MLQLFRMHQFLLASQLLQGAELPNLPLRLEIAVVVSISLSVGLTRTNRVENQLLMVLNIVNSVLRRRRVVVKKELLLRQSLNSQEELLEQLPLPHFRQLNLALTN